MKPEFQSLLDAGTAVIADVFDSIGRTPMVLDTSLFALKGPGTKFIGPAYTVSGESHRWSGNGDRTKLCAIDAIPAGVVAVWAGNDIRGVCCFGDLLASAMLARGCAGVVVDGGVRDLAFLRALDMPVVARYRASAQAIGRWRVTAFQIPVQVRGALDDLVQVTPGDIVVADDDGVIIVPADCFDIVYRRVIESSRSESGARVDIQNGLGLIQALAKYGHL